MRFVKLRKVSDFHRIKWVLTSKSVKQLEHIHENSKACTVESSILYFAKMLSVSIVNYYLSVVIGDYNLRLVAL